MISSGSSLSVINSKSAELSGFIEGSQIGDDLLIGKAPLIYEKRKLSSIKKPQNLKNSDEYEFDMPKYDIKTAKIEKQSFGDSRDLYTSPKTTIQYQKLNENLDAIQKASYLIQMYDQNHYRKKQIMHDEYQNKVINPLQDKFRRKLNSAAYQKRNHKQKIDGTNYAPPIRINTSSCADRIIRIRNNAKRESKLNEFFEPKKDSPKKHFEQDPKRLADTRFFGCPQSARRGKRAFEEKYKSKVEQQIDNFAQK